MHLGMSGRLLLVHPDMPRWPHEHVVWSLHTGGQLRLVDPDGGWVNVAPTGASADCDDGSFQYPC